MSKMKKMFKLGSKKHVDLGCQSVFTKTTRMPPAVYMELLDRVAPLIRRQDTNYRKAITPEERLSLTIRYLTRGDSVTTLHQSYLVGESSVLPIVRDTCKALYAVLHEEFLKPTEWSKSEDKLIAAIQTDDLERIEHLMAKKGASPTKVNPQGITAVHVAALEGKLNVLQFFQQKDVDLTTPDFYGKSPLCCACKSGHNDTVNFLLEANPEMLTAVDHNDLTPLHHACMGGRLDTVRFLLHAGAPVSARDKVGRTPLFICARLGNVDMCKEMLDSGSDINHRDLDKMTAVMFAVEYEHVPTVEYLVRRGANVLLTDAGGRNAASYAKQTDNEEILKILENAPSRASWSLEKVEENTVEATVVDEADMVARFEPVVEESPPKAAAPVAPARKPRQAPPPPPQNVSPPPGFGTVDQQQQASQLEKLEHGIVPMEEMADLEVHRSDYVDSESVQSPTSTQDLQKSPGEPGLVRADSPHFSPEAVLAVEAIMQSTSTPSGEWQRNDDLKVDVEAFKELEEEHEYLNRELQQVSMEKKQLEDKVVVLERRLSGSDTEGPVSPLVAPVQNIIDSTLVESLEEELAEAKNQIANDKEKLTDLEEDVKQLRKQIHIDSKPEAERSADDSWNDSDEDLFESEADIKNRSSSSGAADIAVVASLRSQVLNLERELEELRSQPKVGDDLKSLQRSVLSESAAEKDLESLNQYSSLQHAHDAECQQLQDRIETLIDDNFTLKKELTEAIEEKLDLVSAKDDAEVKVENFAQSKTYMQKQLDHIHKTIETMESVSPLSTEMDVFKQNIESVRNKVGSPETFGHDDDYLIQQERDQLKLSLEKYRMENARLNADLSEIHSQVQGLEGLAIFNTELTNENDRLKEEIMRLMSTEKSSPRDSDQKEIAMLTMQLQQENNDLKSENRSLNSQISDIETTLKETMIQKGQERLQGNPLEKENTSLKSEIQILKIALEEQTIELQRDRPGSSETSPDLELKSQITHLKRTVSQQDETIMELMQQSTRDAQLRHDYERLESECEFMKTKMSEFQALFMGQSEESNKKIQHLEDEIQGLQDENSNLKSMAPARVEVYSDTDKESLDIQIGELLKDKKELEEEKQQMGEQISNFELEILSLRKDADKVISLKEENDLVKEEKLALQIKVADLAAASLAVEASSNTITELKRENSTLRQKCDTLSGDINKMIQGQGELSRDNATVILERDELLQAIPTLKKEIKKLELQQFSTKTAEQALESLQEDYNNLMKEKEALERKVYDMSVQHSQNEPEYFELKAKLKELEEQLETEQSATVMTILDGRTAEQKSTESNLKDEIISLTEENEKLKSQVMQHNAQQNGNAEEIILLSSLQSSAPTRQGIDNHRFGHGLGSSLKKRSEEFRIKEMEEENDRLKTELEKLKQRPYSESQVESMKDQLQMVQDKLELMEKRHRDVVTSYRAHLLKAVRGHMDADVQKALMAIIRIRQAPEVDV